MSFSLFDANEYRELNPDEQALLRTGYHRAIDALRRNIAPRGFSACSLRDNGVFGTDNNYRAVWARDGAKTIAWTADLNLLNLPNHYHNGGIWPFIGGLWVRYVHKLEFRDIARRELIKLARLCSLGVNNEWEFNEWHHGVTGRPMGKAYQTWSAASFIRACRDLHVEPQSMNHI